MLILTKSKGFTVLEVLIALGILTSFSPIITSSLNYVIKSDQKYDLIKNGTFFLESIAKDFKYNLSSEDLSLLKQRFGNEFYVNLKEIATEKHLEVNILDLINANNEDSNNFIKINLYGDIIKVSVMLNSKFDKFYDFVEFERKVK